MKRFNRTDFFLLGCIPVVNILGMLLYGLNVSTHGNYGEGETIPVMLVFVVLTIPLVIYAILCRGQDLGWPANKTVPGMILALWIGPLLLIPFGILQFSAGKNDANPFGPPSPGLTLNKLVFGFLVLALPWAVLLGLAEYWNR